MHGHAWQATNNTISPIVYKFEPILISYFYYVMPVQTYRLAMEEPTEMLLSCEFFPLFILFLSLLIPVTFYCIVD